MSDTLTDYITRDGAVVDGPYTANQAFAVLQRLQPQSIEWARRYEGWDIVPGRFAVEFDDMGRALVVDTVPVPRRRRIAQGFTADEARVIAHNLEAVDRVETLTPYDGWNPYRNDGAGGEDPTWTPDGMRRMAQQQLSRHEHPSDWSRLARENCAACTLNGYLASDDPELVEGFQSGPNYGGWHRVYVEAGRRIPRVAAGRRVEWVDGFLEAISPDYDNPAYRGALLRCVVTFGVSAEIVE